MHGFATSMERPPATTSREGGQMQWRTGRERRRRRRDQQLMMAFRARIEGLDVPGHYAAARIGASWHGRAPAGKNASGGVNGGTWGNRSVLLCAFSESTFVAVKVRCNGDSSSSCAYPELHCSIVCLHARTRLVNDVWHGVLHHTASGDVCLSLRLPV